MNWKKYKSLSKQLKEEYDFRFKHKKINLNVLEIVLGIISIISVFTVWMFIYYLFLTDPRFVDSVEQVKILFEASKNLLMLGTYIIVGFFFVNLINMIITIGMEMYWMRKNKIPILPEFVSKMFKSKK